MLHLWADDLAGSTAAARQAAAAGESLVLWADSAVHGGLWLQAVIRQVQAAVPGARIEAALDCGDRGGDALAALRSGITRLGWSGDAAVGGKLRALGAELQAIPQISGAAAAPGPDRG